MFQNEYLYLKLSHAIDLIDLPLVNMLQSFLRSQNIT